MRTRREFLAYLAATGGLTAAVAIGALQRQAVSAAPLDCRLAISVARQYRSAFAMPKRWLNVEVGDLVEIGRDRWTVTGVEEHQAGDRPFLPWVPRTPVFGVENGRRVAFIDINGVEWTEALQALGQGR